VLCDSYAATVFGVKPESISYIVKAAEMGAGSMNLASARIKFINA